MSSARVLANRYRLDAHAAEGGMGSVWVATDLQLERRVAVKLMSDAFAEQADAKARFLREAQAAAKIQSPHVVSTLDYGVDGSTPYIVMEWLDGESLGARLKRELRLSTSATGAILRQVARGLRSAHELGVVHRDLKPDNLFLQRDHDEEIVKILDFGVAKSRGQKGEQTRTGVILGSLRYMSPEQARANRDTDHRSDLWSLGVIAYRCLTGELPFSGESDGDLLVKICTEAPLPASRHEPALAPLDGFFARCLAKDPGARFASAAELASAYFAALGLDEPSRRTVSPETARVPLPSFSLPPPTAPAQAPSRPGVQPGTPQLAAAPPLAAPPQAAPTLAAAPLAAAPLAASSTPVAEASFAEGHATRAEAPREGDRTGPAAPTAAPPPPSGPGTGPWSGPHGASGPAATMPSVSADPASRSAILVASMPPQGGVSNKLGLAIGIGGAVGVLLALGSLVVLLSTGSGAQTSSERSASPVAERAPQRVSPASAAQAPAEGSGEAVVEPSAPAASTTTESPAEATESGAAPTETARPGAIPEATSSARAVGTSSAKRPGTKPLSRPLIPSNPY